MPGLVLGGLATPLVTAGLMGSGSGGGGGTPTPASILTRGLGSSPLLATRGYGIGAVATAADVFEAAVAYLLADGPTVSAFAGGISADEAAVGDALPYLVLSEPEGSDEYESASADGTPNGLERLQIQAAIYASGKAAARALRRQLRATLKDAPLVFAGGTLLYLRPSTHSGARDPDLGPDGETVWQEVQIFDCLAGR